MEAPAEFGASEAQGASSPPPASSGSSPAAGARFRLFGNKPGRAAASRESIMGLREVAAPTDGSDCCCAICLHEFDADAKLRALPCSHAFHDKCIFQWLRRSATCPLCRHQLPTEAAADEEEEEPGMDEWHVRMDEWHAILRQRQMQRVRSILLATSSR